MSSDFGMIMKRSLSGPFAASFFAPPPQPATIAAAATATHSHALRIQPPVRRPTAHAPAPRSQRSRKITTLQGNRVLRVSLWTLCRGVSRAPLRALLEQQLIHHHDHDHHEPDDQPIVERRAGNLRQRVAQYAEDER